MSEHTSFAPESTYNEKLEKVKALFEAYNQSGVTKLDFKEFVAKLHLAGGVTDDGLRQCRWEDITDFGVPKLLSRQVAEIFRQTPKEKKNKPLKGSTVDSMTVQELLERYCPNEDENLVNIRLLKITKAMPCIIFDDNGNVNVDASVILINEIKDGYPPRTNYVVDGVPRELKAVNQRLDEWLDENPIFAGRALRGKDLLCDVTNRRWDNFNGEVRKIVHIAIHITKEWPITSNQDAHNLLDKLHEANIANTLDKWLGERFPNAFIKYKKMSNNPSGLPSLKVLRKSVIVNKANDPFFGSK